MGDAESKKMDEVFDVERIRELVRLMEEHDLSEVDLRHASQRIRLRRGHDMPMYAPALNTPSPASIPASARGSKRDTTDATPYSGGASAEPDRLVSITSPMVGTYYSRARPESDSFVKVGDHVGPETVVCIIEAMKVFNEIRAETSGKIVAVLVDNEEPVDFGRPLFRVDPGV